MNKSWKTFDQLVASPCSTKSTRKDPRRNSRASRALTQLFPKSPHRTNLKTLQNCSLPDIDLDIEDASDEECNVPETPSQTEDYTIEPCSAPSLEPKDHDRSRLESDIEDVSEDDAAVAETTSSGSDSDCESIRCKRAKKVSALDFRLAKSPGPGCGRRITDDAFVVATAVPRAVTLEKSSVWMKPAMAVSKTSPVVKKRSSWLKLDESFKATTASTAKKSPRWKELERTFQASPEAEIESPELTPENVASVAGTTEAVPETIGCFYEPGKDAPFRRRKEGCPLSRLQAILNAKVSRQRSWLYNRQKGPVVKVESISKIFGRVAISYKEPDRDEPSLQVEHVIYIDPAEKQLKTLGQGSMIEVEYDLEPHKLSRSRVVHLGVCKIVVVD